MIYGWDEFRKIPFTFSGVNMIPISSLNVYTVTQSSEIEIPTISILFDFSVTFASGSNWVQMVLNYAGDLAGSVETYL